MARSVVGQELENRRRSLVTWSVGVAALSALTIGFWVMIADMRGQIEQLLESLPSVMLAAFGASVQELLSPPGYVDNRLLALIAPLLFLIFAVGSAARTVAGEEQDGTLELLLANPVSRVRVVTEKALALGVMVVWLAGVLFVAVALTGVIVDLGLGPLPLLAGTVSLVLLTTLFGSLSLLIACATGRRALAVGVTTAVAVVGYLIDSFAPIVDWLGEIRPVSPFYLYRGARPLQNGLDPLHAGALAALTVLFVLAALWAFERRDVGT